MGRRYEGTTIGLDAIFEPIRSHTWADAASPTATTGGDTLAAGARTVENWFRFANGTIRLGLSEELRLADSVTVMGLQIGVSVRTINYHLKQIDHVQGSERAMREQWNEWMPTWGLSFNVPRLTIAYRGSLTTGTGRHRQWRVRSAASGALKRWLVGVERSHCAERAVEPRVRQHRIASDLDLTADSLTTPRYLMRTISRSVWIGRRELRVIGLCVIATSSGCGREMTNVTPPSPPPDTELRGLIAQWGVLPILPEVAPANPALAQLGRALFFDKILSGNRNARARRVIPRARAWGTVSRSLSGPEESMSADSVCPGPDGSMFRATPRRSSTSGSGCSTHSGMDG